VIAALLPGPWSPVLAAKQIAIISHLYGPHIAINIVSGWFRGVMNAQICCNVARRYHFQTATDDVHFHAAKQIG